MSPPDADLPVRRARVAAVALAVFALAQALRTVLFRVDAFRGFYAAHPWQAGETVWKAGWVVLAVAGLLLVYRGGLRAALRELGLSPAPRDIGRGLLFAVIATAPALVTFAATFSLTRGLTIWDLWMTAVVSPVAEEALFRGYVFRQLYARARWPAWAAVLVQVVPFALGHLDQAERAGGGPAIEVGVLLVTGAGAAVFAWLFVRTGYDLWFVIGLHALLNLYWHVFAVSDTAIGGWIANVARLVVLGLAIWLSRRLARDSVPEAPASPRLPAD